MKTRNLKDAWDKVPKNLDLIIEKFFMRVIKNNSLYLQLRTRMTSVGINTNFKGNTFHSFCEKCFAESKAIFEKHQVDGSPYEYITLAINGLMARLIEGTHMGNQETCMRLGQQTFDLVCKFVFKDTWKSDIKALESEQRKKRNGLSPFIHSVLRMLKSQTPNATKEEIVKIIFNENFYGKLPDVLKEELREAFEEGAFDYGTNEIDVEFDDDEEDDEDDDTIIYPSNSNNLYDDDEVYFD